MRAGLIFLTTLILGALIFNGCTTAPQNTEKVTIVTTLFPLYEFTKEVGGDKVEVTLLLPPGAEAHTFEPKPSDIIKINKADIFLYNGEGMEPWAHDILEGINNDKLIIIDASSKVKLLSSYGEEHEHDELEAHDHDDETHTEDEHNETETHKHDETEIYDHDDKEDHHHGEYDPHIWLDFSNDEKIVRAIAEALSSIDSNNSEAYNKNAENYIASLRQLDTEYSEGLKDCNHNEFITGGHAAFTYLANKYNLEAISAFGISPDSEPTPQKIKEIVDLTRRHNIKYIFFEKLVNPKMTETIASEANAKTLILNPAHNLLKEQFDSNVSFIDLMNENLVNLKTGLECS